MITRVGEEASSPFLLARSLEISSCATTNAGYDTGRPPSLRVAFIVIEI